MRGAAWGFAVAASVLFLPAVPATPAAAQNYVYSTQYCAREFDGAMDCAYFTLRQCQAAVSATGGDCAVNPRYAGDRRPAIEGRREPGAECLKTKGAAE
jgi:hypothetical protein